MTSVASLLKTSCRMTFAPQVMDSLSVDDLSIRVNGNYACDPEMVGMLSYAVHLS